MLSIFGMEIIFLLVTRLCNYFKIEYNLIENNIIENAIENISIIKGNMAELFGTFMYNCVYTFSFLQMHYNKFMDTLSNKVDIIIKFLENINIIKKRVVINCLIEYSKNGNIIANYNTIKNVSELTMNIIDDIFNTKYDLIKYDLIIISDISNKMNKNNNKCMNMITYRYDSENTSNNNTSNQVSNINFFGFFLKYNDKLYKIVLKTGNYNFYMVNNLINKEFLLYYIKTIMKEDVNTTSEAFEYEIELLDDKFNKVVLNHTKNIIIKLDNYEIVNN